MILSPLTENSHRLLEDHVQQLTWIVSQNALPVPEDGFIGVGGELHHIIDEKGKETPMKGERERKAPASQECFHAHPLYTHWHRVAASTLQWSPESTAAPLAEESCLCACREGEGGTQEGVKEHGKRASESTVSCDFPPKKEWPTTNHLFQGTRTSCKLLMPPNERPDPPPMREAEKCWNPIPQSPGSASTRRKTRQRLWWALHISNK